MKHRADNSMLPPTRFRDLTSVHSIIRETVLTFKGISPRRLKEIPCDSFRIECRSGNDTPHIVPPLDLRKQLGDNEARSSVERHLGSIPASGSAAQFRRMHHCGLSGPWSDQWLLKPVRMGGDKQGVPASPRQARGLHLIKTNFRSAEKACVSTRRTRRQAS